MRSEGYEDISIINYLLNIGSSEDIKPETKLENIISNFDIKKAKKIDEVQHLRLKVI